MCIKTNILINILMFITVVITPQYLLAQTYQQDTATIYRLLKSAKSKRFSDSATALREAHQALTIAQKHNDGEIIYDCYHRLARIHEVNNQPKKAHPYFLGELSVENIVSTKTKKNIYSEIADSYLLINDIRMAYEFFIKLFQLGETTQNIGAQQEANLQLGKFYQHVNDFEKATQYLVKSVDLALKMDDPDEICDSYRELTRVYIKTKNYDLAIRSSEKSIFLVDKINNATFSRYYVYLAHGNALANCGKLQEALKPLYKSVELCKDVDDKGALSVTYISLADAFKAMNKIDSANYYYSLCETLIPSMSEGNLMSYQASYGGLLLKKGSYNAAIIQYKKSIALASEFDEKILLQKNYNFISQAYEKIGDKDNSLLFIKKALNLRDSIYSEENTKRTAEAQFKFDLAQSEEQLKTLQSRQTYTIMGGLFMLLCFAVAFLSYFLRSKNEKNRLLLDQTEILTEKTNIIDNKNRQLEESNEILRQFAYASAHDLKEPLRSINSFINIIQKKYTNNLPPEANEYMNFVTIGVKRMESLLNALLEFSSVLSDEDVAHKNNEVPLVLKDVFHHYENIIEEKKAVIRYASVFPRILMNEAHLKQILYNLVHNALKFSKNEAKVEIGYSLKDSEFILSVKDEGIGMDESYGDKIFILFQRLDRVTHKESAGIGLTICKKIMDKYEGRIWFESVVNEGTTFFVAFPKSMVSKIPSAKMTPQYLEHVSADLSAVSNI
jgi:signal transduction histidine kinase